MRQASTSRGNRAISRPLADAHRGEVPAVDAPLAVALNKLVVVVTDPLTKGAAAVASGEDRIDIDSRPSAGGR